MYDRVFEVLVLVYTNPTELGELSSSLTVRRRYRALSFRTLYHFVFMTGKPAIPSTAAGVALWTRALATSRSTKKLGRTEGRSMVRRHAYGEPYGQHVQTGVRVLTNSQYYRVKVRKLSRTRALGQFEHAG